jgi:hypothetical protein
LDVVKNEEWSTLPNKWYHVKLDILDSRVIIWAGTEEDKLEPIFGSDGVSIEKIDKNLEFEFTRG